MHCVHVLPYGSNDFFPLCKECSHFLLMPKIIRKCKDWYKGAHGHVVLNEMLCSQWIGRLSWSSNLLTQNQMLSPSPCVSTPSADRKERVWPPARSGQEAAYSAGEDAGDVLWRNWKWSRETANKGNIAKQWNTSTLTLVAAVNNFFLCFRLKCPSFQPRLTAVKSDQFIWGTGLKQQLQWLWTFERSLPAIQLSHWLFVKHQG